MKLKRSTVIPSLLLMYLCIMATLGYRDFAAGKTSPREYFGIIGITLLVIVVLHFNIKYRDKLHRKRIEDLNKQNEH